MAGAAQPVVELYFGCTCPWSWLAFARLREAALRTGARISYRPVPAREFLGRVQPAYGADRARRVAAVARYEEKDLADWARFCGISLALPAGWPAATDEPERGAVAAGGMGMIVPYLEAFGRAYFGGRGPGTGRDDVLAVAGSAGLDAAEFAARLDAGESRAILEGNMASLAERGGFGTPTMMVGDDLYFGNDRMPLVELALGRASGLRFIMPGDHGG